MKKETNLPFSWFFLFNLWLVLHGIIFFYLNMKCYIFSLRSLDPPILDSNFFLDPSFHSYGFSDPPSTANFHVRNSSSDIPSELQKVSICFLNISTWVKGVSDRACAKLNSRCSTLLLWPPRLSQWHHRSPLQQSKTQGSSFLLLFFVFF